MSACVTDYPEGCLEGSRSKRIAQPISRWRRFGSLLQPLVADDQEQPHQRGTENKHLLPKACLEHRECAVVLPTEEQHHLEGLPHVGLGGCAVGRGGVEGWTIPGGGLSFIFHGASSRPRLADTVWSMPQVFFVTFSGINDRNGCKALR